MTTRAVIERETFDSGSISAANSGSDDAPFIPPLI